MSLHWVWRALTEPAKLAVLGTLSRLDCSLVMVLPCQADSWRHSGVPYQGITEALVQELLQALVMHV